MAYIRFTDEEIAICRNTDLVNLCQSLGYKLKKVGSSYQLVDHDSCMISKRKLFMRFSTKEAGSSIDFLMHMEGKSFRESVEYLLDYNGVSRATYTYDNKPVTVKSGNWFHVSRDESGNITVEPKRTQPTHQVAEEEETEKAPFALPEKTNPYRVKAYLTKTRMISERVVDLLIDQGYIFESEKTHNAVFVGFNKDGEPKHASLRGTYTAEGQKPFKGTVTGSDTRYSFNIVNPSSDELEVFEAPIDAISFFDLRGDDLDNGINYLALTGVHDRALEQFLTDHPHIKLIRLALDNDQAGEEACKRIVEKFTSNEWAYHGFEIRREVAPEPYKDWNEFLVAYRKKEQALGGMGL